MPEGKHSFFQEVFPKVLDVVQNKYTIMVLNAVKTLISEEDQFQILRIFVCR